MKSFNELGVENNIVSALEELGFKTPMPVQEEVIPYLFESEPKDLVVLAQTGTGKTAAFGVPLIQKSKGKPSKIRHLILSPTRELCLQIADDLKDYSKNTEAVKITAVFGGSSIEKQISTIKSGVHIVSATPGRLVDLINRNVVDLSKVETVVLDEADEMLNMGFRDELDAIINQTPQSRNTLLFSATMPAEVSSLSKKYLKYAVEVTIGKKNVGAENVSHKIYFVQSRDRYLALKRIVDFFPEVYGIVFCRTRNETQEIADKLIQDGYNADSLHGDLSQAQRDIVMNKFRIKHLKLLVATDVAARGLDVDDLTHVINYNLPDELEIYTHRSGRTGRAGKFGSSIVIANLKEKHKIGMIEKQLGKKFESLEVPSGKEICEKQLFYLIDRMEKVTVDHTQIDSFLPQIVKKLEWLDREELIKKFVSVEFNRFLDYYKNLADLNKPDRKFSEGRTGKSNSDMTRFFINLGKKDNLKPTDIIGIVKDNSGNKEIEIGEIQIKETFSFFETEKAFENILIKNTSEKDYRGRKINLEIASSRTDDNRKPRGEFRKSRDDFKSYRDRKPRDDSRRDYKKSDDESASSFRKPRDESRGGFRKKREDLNSVFKRKRSESSGDFRKPKDEASGEFRKPRNESRSDYRKPRDESRSDFRKPSGEKKSFGDRKPKKVWKDDSPAPKKMLRRRK
ncbi:MAG: DEAD/DEAH box helicase [Ignavibacteriae bacterium]|nr:DEAD/DEAH box helicase [Ignavibacteriota bacterium]